MAFRAFVALPLPPAPPLAAQLDALGALGADLKLAPPDQLHLTLAFLGDVPDDAGPALAGCLDRAVAGRKAFRLQLHGMGAFPDARHARVVWAGARPQPRLDELAARVRDELARAGFPSDEKPFRAHATLARTRSDKGAARLAEFLRARKDEPLPEVPVDRVTLFRSTLARGGAAHEALHDARLEA